MEAQMQRPFATHEEQSQHTDPHSVVEGAGEVEPQHEKKSVLKKVKAKAKKIKESIKHLGHDHDHDDHEDDDEEYDDEEMVDDPEVHGAPIYESSAMRSAVVPNQDIGMAPKSVVNLEQPTSRKEDRFDFDSNVTIEDKMRQFAHPTGVGRETGHIPAEHNSDMPPASGTSHHRGIERTEREPGARFGVLTGLQEDPQAPMDKPNPSNYESKVTDPTSQRSEEAGVPPLVASFGKMSVEDETKPKPYAEQKESYSGSHDQFSPEEVPISTEFDNESKQFDFGKPQDDMRRDTIDGKSPGGGGITEQIPKHFDSGKPQDDMPRDTIDGKPPGGPGSSYSDKISSAATVIVDKATMAKNVVASKFGYGGGMEEKGGTHTSATDSAPTKSRNSSATEYAHKAAAAVTGTLAPIYGKVAGVGSAVVSKVPGISTDEKGITESSSEANKSRGVTMKEYLAEKLKPGEEDKALSEVISDSLHLQTERAETIPEGAEAGETGGRKPIGGRITESEEVARRLGSGQENRREGTDAIIAGSESSGNTVVDKIKDAVTSWVLKGSESPTSHQGSPGNMEGSKSGLPSNNK